MKFVIVGDVALVALLCCVAAAATATADQSYYHESEGIPKAAAIKEYEARLPPDAENDGGVSHPYLANIVITLTTGDISMCGSSILNNNKLVTAAHCWFDGRRQASRFVIVLGSPRLYSGGKRVTTSNVQVHGSYYNNGVRQMGYNIAIITVSIDIVFTDKIQPVALPRGGGLNDNYASKRAVASDFRISDGAGNSNKFEIQDVSLQVITNNECRKSYANVVDRILCTSTCGGVSGGPLTITSGNRTVLIIGVRSFSTAQDCKKGLPGGFVRITSFMPWIREHY